MERHLVTQRRRQDGALARQGHVQVDRGSLADAEGSNLTPSYALVLCALVAVVHDHDAVRPAGWLRAAAVVDADGEVEEGRDRWPAEIFQRPPTPVIRTEI